MRNITSVLVFLSMVPVSSLSAQTSAAVEPGQRVRVTGPGYVVRRCAPGDDQGQSCETTLFRCALDSNRPDVATECLPIEGTLARWDADSVFLDDGVAFSLASAVRFEVQRRKAFGAENGLFIGLALGGGSGLLVGAFSELLASLENLGPDFSGRSRTEDQSSACGETDCLLRYTAIGAGAGAILGAVLGAIKFAYWEEVPLDRLSASFAPQRDGRFAFGASISF